MDDLSLAELEQLIEMHRARVQQVADDIKALLKDDLPKFVEREMKRGFVNAPEFAAALDDATLSALKADMAHEGQATTEKILAALDDPDLWIPEGAEEEDEDEPRRSMSANEPLWKVVSSICETVDMLRDRYGYPPAEEPTVYRPPTWFIGRRYLPSLTERYWRHVSELAEVQACVREIQHKQSRSELTRRWDQV